MHRSKSKRQREDARKRNRDTKAEELNSYVKTESNKSVSTPKQNVKAPKRKQEIKNNFSNKKTRLCLFFELHRLGLSNKNCRYSSAACPYAHGPEELFKPFPKFIPRKQFKIQVPITAYKGIISKVASTQPGSAFTENMAPSLASTGNALVNLFFKMVRGLIQSGNLGSMLEEAWKENPQNTLKVIFQTRDCRGGKGEKELFYHSLAWLAKIRPELIKAVLPLIPFYGTWKDLLEFMGTPFEEDVVTLFANQLKEDHENMIKGNTKISLCAKWAPTQQHSHDKATKAAFKIAKKLIPHSRNPLKEYRKDYLVPLRIQLKIPEVKMCSNEWESIQYSTVASRCMFKWRKVLESHDPDGFEAFLKDVELGIQHISGKQMFPHELASFYFDHKSLDKVIEVQWKAIIEDIKKSGSLKHSLVLSDVSGSMSGVPMQVSVALGLLISEVTQPPFKNMVLTFHETPTFHLVEGDTLLARVSNIRRMPWGGSTDFQACFDLILGRAKNAGLKPSDMPKRLFVLSDMQFNQATMGGIGQYKTNHEVMVKKYAEAGYDVPQIVYWNLRGDTQDFPVTADTDNVILLSGYSPSLLKQLMANDENLSSTSVAKPTKVDPATVLQSILDGERYKPLDKVFK